MIVMSSEKKRISNKQEKRITKSFKQIIADSRQTIASGNKFIDKGDVINSHFIIEAKTKIAPSSSMVVKKEWFEKIELESIESNRIPLIAISFGDTEDYYIINSKDLFAMVEELIALRKVDE